MVLLPIRTFSAKRLQIERLELGIWYDLGISKEFMKSLCRPFAVKESAEKHLIERLVVEGFLDHSRQAYEQAIAFAAVGRSVHDGQSFRFEIGQRTENAFGLTGVRHVAGQRPLLQLLHRFARRPDQVRRGDRLDIAEVMKEVGAEKRLARLLEQHTRIPACGMCGER